MNLSSAFHRLQLLSITIGGVRAACQEGNKPFKDREELKIAIDTCFEGDDPATAATIEEYNPAKCDGLVKVKYGWPMNTWCTGEVDNMELLFVGKRDFNEDISGEYMFFLLEGELMERLRVYRVFILSVYFR